MKVNRKDVVSSGTPNLPYGRYQARVVDAVFGISKSSGNPMTTLTCELLGQDGKDIVTGDDGNNYAIAGQQFTMFLIYTQDTPTKRGMLSRVFEFNDKLGIPAEDIDTENPDIEPYKGKEFDILLRSNPNTVYQKPLPGEKQGKPLLDAEGKPVVRGYKIDAQLNNVLGVSTFNYNVA